MGSRGIGVALRSFAETGMISPERGVRSVAEGARSEERDSRTKT
jgi:hypothetical protein